VEKDRLDNERQYYDRDEHMCVFNDSLQRTDGTCTQKARVLAVGTVLAEQDGQAL
jgi:hypothetical protein